MGGTLPAEPDRDPAWIAEIRQRLTSWYEAGHRDLPWRHDRDPYRILVSEMMLVQTTVAAVVPYFGRFLERFPTVEALAAADESDVLKAWEGLGYYRRARQLQAAAQAVVGRHGGIFPSEPEALRDLPGVGRYIAGAVASFAFDRPAPIVEANTQRVLARWLAWDEPLAATRSQARLWQAAERLVPERGAGDFNQAFMELGAIVCLPRSPTCLVCPVRAGCRAYELGWQERIPVKTAKPAPLAVSEACAAISDESGRLLLVRRAAGGLWAGFREFPTVHRSGADPAGRSAAGSDLAEVVRRITGIAPSLDTGPAPHVIRYGVTRHKVELAVHVGRAESGSAIVPNPDPALGLDSAGWHDADGLAALPLTAPARRVVAWCLEQRSRLF